MNHDYLRTATLKAKLKFFVIAALVLFSLNACITPVQQEVGAEKESSVDNQNSNEDAKVEEPDDKGTSIVDVNKEESSQDDKTSQKNEDDKSKGEKIDEEVGVSEDIPQSETNTSAEMASSESLSSEVEMSSAIVVNISTMALIRSGCFQMDSISTSEQGHKVCVSPFFMDKNEVTQGEYETITGSSLQDQITLNAWGEAKGEGDYLPMYYVTWQEASDYCEAVGKKLPTSAQWEFAALGGVNTSNKTTYSGSNSVDDVAWYKGNANGLTHSVGLKAPNALGLYDMSGNVLEWTSDWYGTQAFEGEFEQDPQGPKDGSYKVVRGGSWNNQDYQLRITVASGSNPEFRSSSVGFRCVY